MKELTKIQNSMLNLYYFMGYDTNMIAKVYNVRSQTVSTHIRKALKKMGIELNGRTIDKITFMEINEAKERLGIK